LLGEARSITLDRLQRVLLVSLFGALSACSVLTDLGGLSVGAQPCAGSCGDGAAESGVADGGASSSADARTSSADEAGAAVITVVQSAAVHQNPASMIQATIKPTASGNLLVVSITQVTSVTTGIVGVADDAPGGSNVYVLAYKGSRDTACDNTIEHWYARDTKAGATKVIITLTASSDISAWVMEVSGPSKTSPFESASVADDQPASMRVIAPRVQTAGSALVVSTASSCNQVNGLVDGSPFIALPFENGDDAAYYVAPTGGSYGASWTSVNATWTASTVAFH
jgi:hypothetical protein